MSIQFLDTVFLKANRLSNEINGKLFWSAVAVLLSSCMNGTESYVRQHNAIWSESIFFRGYRPSTGELLTPTRLREFGETLSDNRIEYAYIFAGPFQKDGTLPDYSRSERAIRSVEFLHDKFPEIQILPWVGGVQNSTVFLGDSLWVKNALNSTKELVCKLNVPGIHVDLEFILPGNSYLDTTVDVPKPNDECDYGKNVNSFHRKLRELLPNAFISSVVTATSPDTKPWKRKTSIEELEVLTQYIDQLSFLYYDTGIKDQPTFAKNCVALINDIKHLKGLPHLRQPQYLVAIGTFVNREELHGYRNLTIESIKNSLITVIESQVEVDSQSNTVDGIAIFCDWETDATEWNEFNENWIQYWNEH